MSSKTKLHSTMAVLLAMLLVIPVFLSADIKSGTRGKISSELTAKLTASQPDEIVSVIVKMHATPNTNKVRGMRAAVFTELRRNSNESQMELVNYLKSPAMNGKVETIRQFWIDNMILVNATKDVITRIASRPDVLEVFDNYTVTLPPRPDAGTKLEGPNGSSQAAQSPLWDSLDKIGARTVWSSYGFDGTGVVVGGLDTGVDIAHPDIAGKMVTTNLADPTYPGGWGEFDSNGNIIPGTVPHDSDQHGTHTTGTMIGGNASGYDIGVAPGAQLIHGLVIPGGSGTFAQVAGGMEWIIDPDGNPATDDGADVVNMSLGATGTYPEMIAPTDNMVAANVFPSFSAGNGGPGTSTTGSPGNVPSAYAVGATDSGDIIASFSGRGPVTWNNPPYVGTWTKPDISAPGVAIYSSVPGGSWEYSGWNGTSMAAPHVAGTVALMLQANPTLSVAQTKQLLAQTAIDYGDPGMDNTYGWGRVDAFGAVSAAAVGLGTLDGVVYSSGGGTVEGAKVLVTDTGQKVFTNAAGEYSLPMVAGDHTIEVSRFGYETASVLVTIVADVTTTQNVTLTQLSSGTIAGAVTDEDTGYGIEATITVKLAGEPVVTGSTNPVTGEYSIVLPVGTYDLVYSPVFPYPATNRTGIDVYEATTTTVNVELGGAQVLIVDDDAGGSYQAYYESAVLAVGRSYLTVTAPPTAAEMAMFETIVWLTGNDYTTTLSATDQAELAAYLDGGGRLFMSGQDIGYHIKGTPFYSDYLHATYVQDDVALGAVLGVAASPVGAGFAFDIQGGDGANNQAYPSEIDPIAPALPALVYNELVPGAAATTNTMSKDQVGADGITSSGTAGLTMDDGTYKLVYFSFGFEAIATGGDRDAMMGRILDWLQGYPEIDHTPLANTEDTDNPYCVTAVITSDFFPLDPSSFALVYDIGGPETTVPLTATGNSDEYGACIPAQAIDTQVNYYITASDVAGHTTAHPLGAPVDKHTFMVAADEDPPVITHMRYRDTNDLEGPYTICADVTDNMGVESVYLMYSKNGGMVHRATMISQGDDEYCADIPGPSLVGDYYDYYILAMDDSYSGNVTRMPETGAFHFEIVEEFLWDFELDDGGFTQAGDVWEWGSPTTGPGGAHSGVNLWATVLDGNYPNNADATLDIPPITLAASKPYALLSFWHWYSIETNYDGGNVKVSADGGTTWDVVTPFGGYDGTARSGNAGIPGEPCFTGYNNEFWQEELFDLSAYAGQTVMVRFHFGCDGSVGRSGWYVDDVRLRSTSEDDLPPVISDVEVPANTFDTVGPYDVSATVVDPLSGLAGVSVFYSTDDGATFTEIAMTPGGAPDEYTAGIPGQTNGTKVKLYIKATDTASTPNETTSPAGAPADLYQFAILPSAPILVMQMSSSATSLAMLQEALEANGHEADYWNATSQGWMPAAQLGLYKTIIIDETGSFSTTEKNDLATFLASGSLAAKKQIFFMGRDITYYSGNKAFMEEYTRAAYVQDNPAWYQLTGEPGDPIGNEEVFVISGSYPDEMQRSTSYPGGEIVYRYTGEGSSAAETRSELEGAYEKDGKEWDGVMPHAPKSLDAAAGIKYNAEQYRSLVFSFNLYYVQEPERRAGIMHRALGWLSAPDIDHTPLSDTEDTLSAYTVVADVYSETLDPTRVNLTYDVGAGAVTVTMSSTGNPDEYAADIPAQSIGTSVSYYISAANTDGNTSFHPAGAPTEQHTFDVSADNEPPVIVHSPYPNTADQTGPYTITADITDNVGVDPAAVSLTYNKNGGGNTTIAMSNTGGDTYEANIPGPSSLGDVFNYYILAQDIAEVPNTSREPGAGYHSFEVVDYYAWDFEASDGGFTATGPDWEWGDPTTGPMDAYSGVNVWATKLGDNYSASSNSKLDLPALIVPNNATYAALSFWQWYYIETNYDGGNVKISTDGGSSWTILTPDIGYVGTANSGNAGIPGEPCFTGYAHDEWEKVTFDLTAYKGMSVIIRLHFGSDSSVQQVGWYVDDVMVAGAEDTDPPAFVSTDVPASTFDTVGPYTVTTTVLDALSGLSSVDLYYSTDDGSSWTTVAMSPTGGADEYSGDIPGQTSGTRIKLYVEAADNSANTSTDPAGAPATAYEFGIMPSGDYLVLHGGGSETPPTMFQAAFSAIGKTADIWDWDDLGMPTVAILNSYDAVIVDESWYFDATQMDTLGAFLNTSDGSRQLIVMMGRDLSYGSSAKPWMEQYTGSAYVKDSPTWYQLTSTPGDPIGNDETFTISGSYPDELKLSTTYPGASIIYKYSGFGTSYARTDDEQKYREFYEKQGKIWDPKLLPLAPSGPDSAAAVRYVGTTHASVYFAFNFNYIQEDTRRAQILDRTLNWLGSAVGMGSDLAKGEGTPEVPNKLTLWQNYPNPFNPVTTIKVAIPAGHDGAISLKVYSVTGQLVKTIFAGTKPAGIYTFQWDGTSNAGQVVSSGIYFSRFTAGDVKMTKKMILLK